MISLRRLFGGFSSSSPIAAPLGGSLLLVAARRRRIRAEGRLAATKIGRVRASLHAETAAQAESLPVESLDALLDRICAHLDQDQRQELFGFVLETVKPKLSEPDALPLAYALRALRDRLRPEIPELVPHPGGAHVAVVDVVVEVDRRSFWVAGWASDIDEPESRVELISPEGHRVQLLPGARRFNRADVGKVLAEAGVSPRKNGYVMYFELDAPSLVPEGWVAELTTAAGAKLQIPAPAVTRDAPRARQAMLWQFAVDRAELEPVRLQDALPALERMQRRHAGSVEVEQEVEYGSVPGSPEVSIVIPLYRRVDLVEHQLAQFWRDPDLMAAELIYVLDSPEQAEELNRLASSLHELFGLPFKVLTLSRNGGYAVANNLGAARASGRLLLLLNSDVLPAEAGWLTRMRSFYDATPDIGALGPKLLYEDESIQHAGMYFKRDAVTRLWENQHYFKGFSRSLEAANVTCPVPAVTGACMMVERALWDTLGGLAPIYVQGGYEDSDFCIRLVEHGRRNWYVADVELYHLEAQSFYIHTRLANPCNAWIQTHLWDAQIQKLMDERPEVPASGLVAVG